MKLELKGIAIVNLDLAEEAEAEAEVKRRRNDSNEDQARYACDVFVYGARTLTKNGLPFNF